MSQLVLDDGWGETHFVGTSSLRPTFSFTLDMVNGYTTGGKGGFFLLS